LVSGFFGIYVREALVRVLNRCKLPLFESSIRNGQTGDSHHGIERGAALRAMPRSKVVRYLVWAAIAALGAYALALLAFARGALAQHSPVYHCRGLRLFPRLPLLLVVHPRRVLELDGSRTTPAVRLNNGRGYVPTSRWIRFGHHFAAIAGPGPLVGLLAAQFGYLPQSSGL
jgi:hypothetical protein